MTRADVESGLLPALQVKGRAPERHHVLDRMRRYQVPGAAVAMVVDGEIAWTAEYGCVAVGGSAVTAATLFQAASISKAVAAIGVLSLVEHGVLDLDRNVNDYLSSWQLPVNEHNREVPVTLRRLLSHTAGTTVPGFPGYPVGSAVPSPAAVLSGVAPANTPTVESYAVPGSVSQYSGGGSTIVQQIVIDVTGRDYAALMHDLVLRPFGMQDSAFDQPIGASRAGRAAIGHHADGTPVHGGWHVYPELQAAGLWTTAADLARWVLEVQRILAGATGGPISPDTARLMIAEVEPGPFGLGPEMAGVGKSRRFGHGGSNAGYRSQIDALVDGGSGMVMMTNGDGGTTLCGEFRRSVAAVHGWGEIDAMHIDVVDVDPEVLESYTGRYRGPFELRMKLEFVDGELFSPAPYGRRRMFPLGPTTFLDEESGATLEFECTNGEVSRVAVLVGNSELMAFEPAREEEK